MKNSLLKTFFSSGMQALAVQVLGVLFFYVAADYMTKDDFGIINWVMATSVIITTFIGFGLDQVVVRRIAASKSSNWAGAAYLFHTFISSAITFFILLLITHFFDEATPFYERLRFLPWFFGVQAILYIGLPLKQFLNAKHNFTPYAVIAVLSNILKITLAVVYVKFRQLTIVNVGIILGICALVEFISLIVYLLVKTDFSFRFKFVAYSKLLKESFPQYISSIFDISLSRLDWLLLGIMSTAVVTADYSLAYKGFEVARLPITVIAPIILNIFARMLLGNNRPDAEKQKLISELYRAEIFVAMLFPVILSIIWAPALDLVFKGKYGSVNADQFMILSLSIPLMFLINLFWTLGFSIKKYKQISTITVIGALCNLIFNLVLIPYWGGLGSAVAFLLTIVIQLSLYFRLAHKYIMTFSVSTLLILYIIGGVAYGVAVYVSDNVFIRLLTAVVIYIGASVLTKVYTLNNLKTIKLLFKK